MRRGLIIGKGLSKARQSQLLDRMNQHVQPLQSGNGSLQMSFGTVQSFHIFGNFTNRLFGLSRLALHLENAFF
jgi:hypothetical protein